MGIKESELIITKEGRIYHLGLKPDEIGDFIITVGDPDRVERVSKYFDEIEIKNHKREFITHTGRLGSKRISVIGTGIGPDNIDIMLNEVDALKNIDFETRTINSVPKSIFIIRMGTSGALREDIPIDSMVISTHGLGIDGLMNFYQYEKNEFQNSFEGRLKEEFPGLYQICFPYIFEGSDFLLEKIGKGLIQGITMTAGGFYGPQGRQLRIEQKIHEMIDRLAAFEFKGFGICNFEMETSAIYGISKLLGHNALSVNAIIANRATKKYSSDQYKTVDNMIKTTLERIDAI
ncbi:MAG: nucleoside phosphorylase [Saprospiraceae bacterium]|nr:nucleoside phosphorylase [Saprospiraceae bacterium]